MNQTSRSAVPDRRSVLSRHSQPDRRYRWAWNHFRLAPKSSMSRHSPRLWKHQPAAYRKSDTTQAQMCKQSASSDIFLAGYECEPRHSSVQPSAFNLSVYYEPIPNKPADYLRSAVSELQARPLSRGLAVGLKREIRARTSGVPEC